MHSIADEMRFRAALMALAGEYESWQREEEKVLQMEEAAIRLKIDRERLENDANTDIEEEEGGM
eukprot:CAMPEP_0182421738 /NCGR_PEP_ID=MMETSP1167-20130531/7201_1 /TAXON_ID=2988 /ORGANISM="Mallomonas Sp, Strain CCMP3275" /LENGTH=63 /DNA_ID=CAMNT_0024599145 /DNA_START=24 /DNA_END=212 /DNA_ORIENTATION=-